MATAAAVNVSVPEERVDKNEVTVADARKKNHAVIPTLVGRTKSAKSTLSDVLIGTLLVASDNSDATLSNEVLDVFKDYNVNVDKINEVRAAMADSNFFRSGFEKRITSLGVQPELQKPREFDFAPGVPLPEEDAKYWPKLFQTQPSSEGYEKGDLVYFVHENKSFTVLSAEQQTVQWQSQHHLPSMNMLETVGGKVEKTKK